jgi:L-fuculose-phosphate aldolase
MKPEHIVQMDLDGAYRGAYAPSSEWRIHADIYRARKDAGAILHTHANFCTSLACLGRAIPAFHYMIAVAGGHDIRCAPYATFGTQALSDHAVKALEDRKACLLANHGMVCLDADLGRCLALAVEVETLACQYWHALQIGKPKILPRAEMRRVTKLFETYGKPREPAEAPLERGRL